jgi:hypothetical protein
VEFYSALGASAQTLDIPPFSRFLEQNRAFARLRRLRRSGRFHGSVNVELTFGLPATANATIFPMPEDANRATTWWLWIVKEAHPRARVRPPLAGRMAVSGCRRDDFQSRRQVRAR